MQTWKCLYLEGLTLVHITDVCDFWCLLLCCSVTELAAEERPDGCFPVPVTHVSSPDRWDKTIIIRKYCVLWLALKKKNWTIFKCRSCYLPLCICFIEWIDLQRARRLRRIVLSQIQSKNWASDRRIITIPKQVGERTVHKMKRKQSINSVSSIKSSCGNPAGSWNNRHSVYF